MTISSDFELVNSYSHYSKGFDRGTMEKYVLDFWNSIRERTVRDRAKL